MAAHATAASVHDLKLFSYIFALFKKKEKKFRYNNRCAYAFKIYHF